MGFVCLVASAVGAQAAEAGSFRLRSCMAARGEGYDSAAFAGSRSSARMTIKRACDPFGHGTRGLVTGNKIAHRRLRRNERATVVLSAPAGTRITGFKWSGGVRRGDCGFTVELYAVRPHQSRSYIRRERAGKKCPKPHNASASYSPARPYKIGSATSIVQRVVCRSKNGCSASRLTMLVTRYAAATISDPARPRVRITGGGLASGRWVRGSQNVRFAAADNVGMRDARLFVAGRQFARAAVPCNFSRRI